MDQTMTATKETAPFVSDKERQAIPQNRFGLKGIDHFGLPCRDPALSGKFIEQILGGVEFYVAGYSEEDLALGRLRHIFYHVGDQLVETVEVEDRKAYPDVTNPESQNSNPHWSFATTGEGMAAFVEHLKEQGIPFNGPRSHRGISALSLLFRDVDDNNLEVTTWETVPPGVETTPMGGEYGFVPWKELSPQLAAPRGTDRSEN